MKIIEFGHIYLLKNIVTKKHNQVITFLKRSGKIIKHKHEHSGTIVQEVLRVLINRTIYLNDALYCEESEDALYYLRMALFIFEARAYRRKAQKHNRKDTVHSKIREQYKDIPFTEIEIELLSVGNDGHIIT